MSLQYLLSRIKQRPKSCDGAKEQLKPTLMPGKQKPVREAATATS